MAAASLARLHHLLLILLSVLAGALLVRFAVRTLRDIPWGQVLLTLL
jgi:hypothetical protein